MDNTIKDYLEELYHDTSKPAAFSGVDKLYREAKKENIYKISRNQIKTFLQSQEDYTVQRQNNRRFKRRRVIAPYVGYQADSDTANFVRYSKQNNGYKYFVVVIGVMSKKAYTRPLKSLKSEEMAKALKSIFKESDIKYERLRTDQGSEYKGKVI